MLQLCSCGMTPSDPSACCACVVQARNSRQDQIHNSIVSTLLALMDGLDSRGQVVIIGATNRIDSLDSALRRPGRLVTVGCRFLIPELSENKLHSKAEESVYAAAGHVAALAAGASARRLQIQLKVALSGPLLATTESLNGALPPPDRW